MSSVVTRGLRNVEGRHSAELAPVPRIGKGPRAVHRGAVIPDNKIANAPRMAIHELRLRGVFNQIAQQEPPLGNWPIDDP